MLVLVAAFTSSCDNTDPMSMYATTAGDPLATEFASDLLDFTRYSQAFPNYGFDGNIYYRDDLLKITYYTFENDGSCSQAIEEYSITYLSSTDTGFGIYEAQGSYKYRIDENSEWTESDYSCYFLIKIVDNLLYFFLSLDENGSYPCSYVYVDISDYGTLENPGAYATFTKVD